MTTATTSVPTLFAEPGTPRERASFWHRYREALTSSDFLFAGVTLVLTLVSWLTHLAGGAEPIVRWTGIAAALAGGIPIAYGAARGLISREMNVDELVTVAIIASIVVGEYLGASLVAFMMLFGKVLEDFTAARAEHALAGLGQLVPSMARLKDAAAPGGERSVPVEQVAIGDLVVVRPGERIPVDGSVVAGHAAVEQAAITGESVPADKGEGDEVFAGTLATGGALEVRTVRVGAATALGRIAVLVKQAEGERAPIVRTADRWAKWFTPAVLALAVMVYLVRGELLPAISVLVVACPCALVLATPTAVMAGIARGARRGILIKGGARLEAAGHVDAVCLDKTGTLTRGRPVVKQVVPLPCPGVPDATDGTGEPGLGGREEGIGEAALLIYAAAAEHRSEHPVARAVVEAARARGVPPPAVLDGVTGFVALPGRGVAAGVPLLEPREADESQVSKDGAVEVLVGRPEFLQQRGVTWPPEAQAVVVALATEGQTALAVAVGGRPAGVIGVADEVRPEAATAVAALRAAGLRQIVLLTGDRIEPALAVARAVGIAEEDVHAGLLPEEKVAWIRRLKEQGHRVAMIGDGVNDAPAMATADVAIAMGAAGTDLALETADIALMTDDLRQAAAAIQLSRKTLATIRQNLIFAAAWNVVAVALVAVGALGIVAGALVHNAGSVAVVVNAARLAVGRDRPSTRSSA